MKKGPPKAEKMTKKKKHLEALDLYLDKVNTNYFKSTEQLKAHTIDPQIENNIIEKAIRLFSTDEDVQKVWAVQAIPEMVRYDSKHFLDSVWSKMIHTLKSSSDEVRIAASIAIRTILHDQLLPSNLFISHFMSTIMQALNDTDQNIVSSWCDTLCEAIKVLPTNEIQEYIRPYLQKVSEINSTPFSRICCSRIIAQLSSKYEPIIFKKDLLPTVTSLCQDVTDEVRAEIASHLGKIALNVGGDPQLLGITQILLDLGNDESSRVKENTFMSSVQIMKAFPPEKLKGTIVALLCQMLFTAYAADRNLVVTISKQFGEACELISSQITPINRKKIIDSYNKISLFGLLDVRDKKVLEDPVAAQMFIMCRQQCALNLSKLVKFSVDGSLQNPFAAVDVSMKSFIIDPSDTVRRAFAQNLILLLRDYPRLSFPIKDMFCKICYDEFVDVFEVLLGNLFAIMQTFNKNGVYKLDSHDEVLIELVRSVLKLEETLSKSYKWRNYIVYISQVKYFYAIIPYDLFYSNFYPTYIKKIHSCRVVPIRCAVFESLLLFMRFCRLNHHREIRDKIIPEFCTSINFYDRMLYVRMVPTILNMYSIQFFSEFFYLITIRLLTDPVANIRYALIEHIPKFDLIAKLSRDNQNKIEFSNAMVMLEKDKDMQTRKYYISIKSSIGKVANQSFPNNEKKFEEEKKSGFFDKREDKKLSTVGRPPAQRPPVNKPTPSTTNTPQPKKLPYSQKSDQSKINNQSASGSSGPPGSRPVNPRGGGR